MTAPRLAAAEHEDAVGGPVGDGRPPAASGFRHPDQTRIMLRPVASGLPLGFFAFAIGMLVLGCRALGWIPGAELRQIGIVLVGFVFPLELIATVFAFLARDTMGATTLGLFTTSWLTFGWSDLSSPSGSTSVALAVYLFGFATAALLLATLSTGAKPFFSVLLLAAAARMILAGVHEAGGGTATYRVAGGIALGLTAVAMYGGTALGLEDARHREVLPLFRRGAAAESFAGIDRQLDRLEAEPGIRQQL